MLKVIRFGFIFSVLGQVKTVSADEKKHYICNNCLSNTINIMAVDDLATQGARTSAAMVLIQFA